jgi:two-component system NarL family sensor kinase
VSLTHPATDRGEDFEFVLSGSLYLAWMGVAAVLLARILTHRAARVRRLLAEVLGAEERERKLLAEALHDETIQDLLAAGQDLDEASGGDPVALRRAREEVRRSVAQLRTTIADLHPFVLEHAGLEAALRSLVDRRRQRGDLRWNLHVERAAVGPHDRLVVSVARELIANAAKHAGAGEVNVRLRSSGREVLVEVADDGPGLDRERAAGAVAEGHVGLASCAERVQAAGGRLELIDRPGGGTLVRVRLPSAVPSAS